MRDESPERKALRELIAVLADGRIDATSRQRIKRAATYLTRSPERRRTVIWHAPWKSIRSKLLKIGGIVGFVAALITIGQLFF